MLLKQTVKQDNQSLNVNVTPRSKTKSAGLVSVSVANPISTGFMLGIGLQLSLLVFGPIVGCVVGVGMLFFGVLL